HFATRRAFIGSRGTVIVRPDSDDREALASRRDGLGHQWNRRRLGFFFLGCGLLSRCPGAHGVRSGYRNSCLDDVPSSCHFFLLAPLLDFFFAAVFFFAAAFFFGARFADFFAAFFAAFFTTCFFALGFALAFGIALAFGFAAAFSLGAPACAAGPGELTANAAPDGSMIPAMRLPPGTSMGGSISRPPIVVAQA